jgi:uncharacterized membrane-anchored protein
MRKAVLFFALVALAQWAVPLWMVSGKEQVLSEGAEYKFKLRPIDPTDPFRGEYVTLNFAGFDDTYSVPDGEATAAEVTAYGLLGTDEEGYARVYQVTMAPPPEGDYIRVKGHGYSTEGTLQLSGVQPEFDRYYLQQGGGPVAEDLVRWRQGEGTEREVYALVSVNAGDAVIEDLIIDGRSINAWIDEAKAAADTATAAP